MDRILIVDDDRAICDLIRDILAEIRMTGVCAYSDREAYRIISALPTIRGLIVDVDLGTGVTGFDIARFARQVVPNLPVVFVTGAATRSSFQAFGVPGSAFFQKPFDFDDLLSALLSQMDRLSPANA
jgi:DNA-binding NtrC family response regulator